MTNYEYNWASIIENVWIYSKTVRLYVLDGIFVLRLSIPLLSTYLFIINIYLYYPNSILNNKFYRQSYNRLLSLQISNFVKIFIFITWLRYHILICIEHLSYNSAIFIYCFFATTTIICKKEIFLLMVFKVNLNHFYLVVYP